MEAEWGRGSRGGPGAGSPVPQASPLGQLTLSVAAVRKVLALHDLLHDVVRVDPSIIHPGWVALHGVLLPPGRGGAEQSHSSPASDRCKDDSGEHLWHSGGSERA